MSPIPLAARVRKIAVHFGADASARVAAALARLNPDKLAISQREVAGGSIGCVGGAFPAAGNLCCFTGAPINGPDVGSLVDTESATRHFPEYDGPFVGIHWDAERRQLVVATDCLGMQPLYLRNDGGEMTLVSDTKALSGDPDLAAWGAFIAIGHPIGSRSLMHGLARVPPASILTYDCATRHLSVRRYWRWPQPSDAWRRYDFLDALERDIRGYAAFGSAGTLLLSGGFDSRLLLFLLQRARVPADALIVAHADEYDDLDGRLAEAVARIAGVKYRKAHPGSDFFSTNAYLDYLQASDAGYPSVDLFIAKVAAQIHADAVWDGLAPGFVFMPLHQPAGGFPAYLRQEIRGPDSAAWRAASALFRPDVVAAMRDGFERDLESVRSGLPQDEYGLARFVIENRSRNRPAMNPLKVYARRADAFVPGISKEFITHAAIIPHAEKRGGRFYRGLLTRLDRRALAIPFASGGELLPNAAASVAYQRERLHIRCHALRAHHPRLFGATAHPARCSAFLVPRLLEEDDAWVDPRARDRLVKVTPESYATWKLLFHWKAWQWLHAGKLQRMLGPYAEPVIGP